MRKINAEPEPMLKEIPMMTADEVEIKLNSVLYRVSWSTGYDFKKEGKGEIEALRVFFVNNSARQFRVKCVRGCEETFKFAEGCASRGLYGKMSSAVEELQRQIDEDIEKCDKKLLAVKGTKTHLESEKMRAKRFKEGVKVPREVRA